MKKTFTLLLFICLGTTLFAQSPQERNGNRRGNDVAYNDRKDWNNHHNDRRYASMKQRMQEEIDAVNLHYDRKIRSVNNNWFMNPFRKKRIISDLECKRKEDISDVYSKFNKKFREYGYSGPGRH